MKRKNNLYYNMLSYEKILSVYKKIKGNMRNKKNLIIATIKDTDRFNTHENLYEKYFNEYERYKILDKYTFSINDKKYKNYYLYIKNDFYMLLKENEKDKLRLDIIINSKINRSIAGSVNIILNDKLIHSETLYAINKKNRVNSIKKLLYF